MIYFCNDRIRGIDDKESAIYVKMFVEFRQHLKDFPEGNDLKVFMCIALHANNQGWAEVPIKQIMRETGIKTADAVIESIKRIYAIVIGGKRILVSVKTRLPGSKRFSTNKYLIFPSAAEYASIKNAQAETAEIFFDEPIQAEPNRVEPYPSQPDRLEETIKEDNTTVARNNDVTKSAPESAKDGPTQSEKILNAATDGESLAHFFENVDKPLTDKSLSLIAGAYNAGNKRKDMRDRINDITFALRNASVKHSFGVMWNNAEIKEAIKQVAGRGDETVDVVMRVVEFVENGRKAKPGAWQYLPPDLCSQMILRDAKPGSQATTQDKIRDASSDQDKANLSYAGKAIKK